MYWLVHMYPNQYSSTWLQQLLILMLRLSLLLHCFIAKTYSSEMVSKWLFTRVLFTTYEVYSRKGLIHTAVYETAISNPNSKPIRLTLTLTLSRSDPSDQIWKKW